MSVKNLIPDFPATEQPLEYNESSGIVDVNKYLSYGLAPEDLQDKKVLLVKQPIGQPNRPRTDEEINEAVRQGKRRCDEWLEKMRLKYSPQILQEDSSEKISTSKPGDLSASLMPEYDFIMGDASIFLINDRDFLEECFADMCRKIKFHGEVRPDFSFSVDYVPGSRYQRFRETPSKDIPPILAFLMEMKERFRYESLNIYGVIHPQEPGSPQLRFPMNIVIRRGSGVPNYRVRPGEVFTMVEIEKFVADRSNAAHGHFELKGVEAPK